MFVNRGDNGGATDNNATITQILQLRAERAQLLDGGRALQVGAHEQWLATLALEPAGQLRRPMAEDDPLQ